jgi:hypothetical protein
VLRMVRQVARVLNNRLPIDPEGSCHRKGRCAVGQALGDFRLARSRPALVRSDIFTVSTY